MKRNSFKVVLFGLLVGLGCYSNIDAKERKIQELDLTELDLTMDTPDNRSDFKELVEGTLTSIKARRRGQLEALAARMVLEKVLELEDDQNRLRALTGNLPEALKKLGVIKETLIDNVLARGFYTPKVKSAVIHAMIKDRQINYRKVIDAYKKIDGTRKYPERIDTTMSLLNYADTLKK